MSKDFESKRYFSEFAEKEPHLQASPQVKGGLQMRLRVAKFGLVRINNELIQS